MIAKELQQLISPVFDESVLVDILQKSSGYEQVTVTKVNLKDSATNKGDSYLSSIVRFTVEGTVRVNETEQKTISSAVIVKALPSNIGRRKSFRSSDFFRNEAAFYNKIWDAFLKFQDSKSISNKFDNVPVCYSAVSDGENDYIALEDLNVQSYVPYKRQNEMDYDNIIKIIRLFARFHSLSFAFKDQFPKEFQELTTHNEETYFAENHRGWYTAFHKSLIACSRDAIQKELPPSYLAKFDEMVKKDHFGLLVKVAHNKNEKFSVFTQGDAWIPNFLTKYDNNNQVVDVKLIDFQLARCCSMACDLSFFLYTCTSTELLNKHWDDIMFEYHNEFTKFLTELGSDPAKFTLDDLNTEMKLNSIFGYSMSMEGLPFQMMDDSEAADLDSIEGVEAVDITQVFKVYPLKTREHRLKLANPFKHAVDKGFI